MANVNVTYDDLTQQAVRFDAGRDEMQGVLDRLKAEVDSLVSSGFVTDQASGAFLESYTMFTTGATTAINGINGMSSFLRNAAQILSETDQALAAGIRG